MSPETKGLVHLMRQRTAWLAWYLKKGTGTAETAPEDIQIINRAADEIERLSAPPEGQARAGEAECERAVGRFVYDRVAQLRDAKVWTPEYAELGYLARLVSDVEEYDAKAVDWEPPVAPAQPPDREGAVQRAAEWTPSVGRPEPTIGGVRFNGPGGVLAGSPPPDHIPDAGKMVSAPQEPSPALSGEELVEAVARVIAEAMMATRSVAPTESTADYMGWQFSRSHSNARQIITLIRSSLGGGDGK